MKKSKGTKKGKHGKRSKVISSTFWDASKSAKILAANIRKTIEGRERKAVRKNG